jgi:TPR repeat protein
MCEAADGGNTAAKLLILMWRLYGSSVCGQPPTNDSKGVEQLALAAAEQGDPFAMEIAGNIYESPSAKMDTVRAYAWYTVAARRAGRPKSDALGQLEAKLSAEELSQGKDLAEELDRKTPRAQKLGPLCSPPG